MVVCDWYLSQEFPTVGLTKATSIDKEYALLVKDEYHSGIFNQRRKILIVRWCQRLFCGGFQWAAHDSGVAISGLCDLNLKFATL